MALKNKITITLFVFILACGNQPVKQNVFPKQITIYSVDKGKDLIQAKNKALSFLSDMRAGYHFNIQDKDINVYVKEVEINFIVGSRIFEIKNFNNEAVYFCKMTLNIPGNEYSSILKITKKFALDDYFVSKKKFMTTFIKSVLIKKFTKKNNVKGIIYITGISGISKNGLNKNLEINFTVLYK